MKKIPFLSQGSLPRTTEQHLSDVTEMLRLLDECTEVVELPPMREFEGSWRHKVKLAIGVILAPLVKIYLRKQNRLNYLLVHSSVRISVLEQRIAELEKRLENGTPS